MPGNIHNTVPNRYIKSELKSHKIVWEEEHPIRWSYMKILREFSTLKEFYPEIDPYVEVFRCRDNMWAIYQESFDGAGDVWMYLISGPEKAMLIDTGFGVGNLKGLAEKLTGGKPLIVANTHYHFDHCYGNAQFDTVYCNEDEVFELQTKNNPHIWDYLYDRETGKGIYADFDVNDIIPWKEYRIEGVPANHVFDLGRGYEVELIPLVGHSVGQSGYLDRANRVLICGDVTGIGRPLPGEPKPENCTVEALRDCFRAVWSRHDEYDGVFFGHAPLDQTNVIIKYHLDACEHILADPSRCDEIRERDLGDHREKTCMKYIQQGTAIKYSLDRVYKSQISKP